MNNSKTKYIFKRELIEWSLSRQNQDLLDNTIREYQNDSALNLIPHNMSAQMPGRSSNFFKDAESSKVKLESTHSVEDIIDGEVVHYDYELYVANDPTGEEILAMRVTDREMNYAVTVPIMSRHRKVFAELGYWGSKHSRSEKSAIGLLDEVVSADEDPGERIGKIIHNWGHRSVGDNVNLYYHLEGCSMYRPMFAYAETGTGKGTEKSSRYITEYMNALMEAILQEYPNLPEAARTAIMDRYGQFSGSALDRFKEYFELLHEELARAYPMPKDTQKNRDSLRNRTLDCARAFLPMGAITGMYFTATAREVSRLIGVMKAAPRLGDRRVGHLLQKAFAPIAEVEEGMDFIADGPELIRHTEPVALVQQNLGELKRFLEEESDLFAKVTVNTVYKNTPTEQTAEWIWDDLLE